MKTEHSNTSFTNKTEYLDWCRVWKAHYAALTQQIRTAKAGRKSKDATERSLAQCRCWLLRRDATAELELRKASKLKAQEQYLAGHAIPVPAA